MSTSVDLVSGSLPARRISSASSPTRTSSSPTSTDSPASAPSNTATASWDYDDDDAETTAALQHHHALVAQVAAQARTLFDAGLPYRVFHGSTNTTRPRDATQGPSPAVLDISELDRVLRVDAGRRRALVEPNVPMDRLVAAVQSATDGMLMPPVVMEFPGITAGGGFAGTGGESASFRHGFFDETVARVEMLLADGQLVVGGAQEGDDPVLLHAAAGAVGTLGTVTLLEMRLVPARPWVKTTYRRTESVEATVEAVQAATTQGLASQDPDFVDAILFDKTHGALITGVLTDDKPDGVQPQTFSCPWDPWFYLHARDKTASEGGGGGGGGGNDGNLWTEYIPLAEYLFRYDRGGFWVGRTSFLYFFMVPFNRLTRWLFDDILHTRMMYRAMHAAGGAHAFVLQDMAVPFDRSAALVDFAAATLGIWPVWLCPLRRRPGPTFHPAVVEDTDTNEDSLDHTHMLNVGVWGPGPLSRREFRSRNEALETRLTALGGRKWLYASTYFAEDAFWALYGGRAWYDALRTRYRATALPSVYAKVHVKDDSRAFDWAAMTWRDRLRFIWPFGGILGIWHSLQTGDHLLHRNAAWRYKK